MKIAFYVPTWPPGDAPNGIVTYASHLVPALRLLGHEVFLVAHLNGQGNRDPHTVDLRHFAPASTVWNRALFKLAPDLALFGSTASAIVSAVHELITKHEIDVLEIEESFGWSSAICREKLLPVVVRLHGPWCMNGHFANDQNPLNGRRDKWEGRGIHMAHAVTAPSAAVLDAVQLHYDLNLATRHVIPNPIEAAPEADIWNADTCVPDSILFVGRFDALKGGDLVLRAFVELAALYPRVRLTFVGPDRGVKGAAGDTLSFADFIRANVPEWVRPRIAYRGKMSHSDVMSLRVKHFATIVASQHEMMPYSVLEAMSFGCPLVATAVGGIPELIEDHRNGLLIPSQNVKAMVAACEALLQDTALAARLGLQAWKDCYNSNRPKRIAQATVEAHQDAIDRFRVTGVSPKVFWRIKAREN